MQGTFTGLATTLRRRLCAFAVGASAGCGAGMYYLLGDIDRASAAVAASVDVVAAAKRDTHSAKPVVANELAAMHADPVDLASNTPRISST